MKSRPPANLVWQMKGFNILRVRILCVRICFGRQILRVRSVLIRVRINYLGGKLRRKVNPIPRPLPDTRRPRMSTECLPLSCLQINQDARRR